MVRFHFHGMSLRGSFMETENRWLVAKGNNEGSSLKLDSDDRIRKDCLANN